MAIINSSPLVFMIRDGFRVEQLAPGVIVLLSASMAMTAKFGSPMNWWQPFFGLVMKVNTDKLAVREQAGEDAYEIQGEIQQWVKTCTKGRWERVNPYTYKFLRKGDAAMFKLAWG